MNLREETRVAEQTRTAKSVDEIESTSDALNGTQDDLLTRTNTVIRNIKELEHTKDKRFPKALRRLNAASVAMSDAVDLLAAMETGGPTIAAETEAIEALLVTTRGGGGGGGGGDSPGGGGGGGSTDAQASALAGLGDGIKLEDRLVDQSVGTSRTEIPEEFRAGLDAYFGAVDGQGGG